MGIPNMAAKALATKALAKDGKRVAAALANRVEKAAAPAARALGADSLKLSSTRAAVKTGTKLASKSGGKIVNVAFNDTYKETIALNEPLAHASSMNTDKNLFNIIDQAKKSIDGSFYDIEDLGVTQKLLAAKKRGVDIRLVTDTDNLVDKLDPTKPREAITKLKAAHIPVIDDQRSAIMHDKYMIVDGKTVWTGSANLTPRSLYDHNNNALTIQSKELADQFDTEFNRLFEHREFGASIRPDLAPNAPVRLQNGQIQAFFSPDGGARQAVLNELAGAKKSIKFLTFSLTDKDIGKTMLAKAKAGVKVEGVFDRWLAAGDASLYEPFRKRGLQVYKDGNEALMHHKVMLIDNKTVITGSFNFSQNAEHNNNEAMLIIKNAPQVAKDYAKEFDRVKFAAQHNHPPAFVKNPDAEITAANKTAVGH